MAAGFLVGCQSQLIKSTQPERFKPSKCTEVWDGLGGKGRLELSPSNPPCHERGRLHRDQGAQSPGQPGPEGSQGRTGHRPPPWAASARASPPSAGRTSSLELGRIAPLVAKNTSPLSQCYQSASKLLLCVGPHAYRAHISLLSTVCILLPR